MSIVENNMEEKTLDRAGEAWTDEEDKLLIHYRSINKTPGEIGVLLNRSEFSIHLRTQILIYRFHRNGVSVSQIRLIMNVDLSQILSIIKPVRPKIKNKNDIWNNLWNSI